MYQLVEPVLIDARQELDRVAVDRLPEVPIQADEEILPDGRPGPPQVVSQISKTLEGGRETRNDGEVPQREHVLFATLLERPAATAFGVSASGCFGSVSGQGNFRSAT
jgi:hypothetical protein